MVKQASFALCAVLAVLSSSCGSKKPSDQSPDPAGPPPGLATGPAPTIGLIMRLSSGTPDAPDAEQVPQAPAQPLPQAQTQRLLARLPALPADPGVDFALPPRSRPAPRAGKDIDEPFPPARPSDASAPAADPTGPLTVLRYAPEGDVPLAPHLSVTFSQPMVAVTAQGEAAATVPVKLTPTPPGQWRWVGTRTLLFEAKPRLPQATRYRVDIPASTRAAGGQTLGKPMSFAFATPPPQVVQSYPSGPAQPRTPRMLLVFDQDIDAAAVLAKLQVHAAGKTHATRALTPSEIAADQALTTMIEAAAPRRHVAFTVEKPLPVDSDVTVEIPPGTPSAEGPRTTEKAQRFAFRTHGPLAVVESQCGWRDQCQPGNPWRVRFSNPLDPARFDTAAIRVAPALPDQAIEVVGEILMIHGQSKGRTTYQVTLPAHIVDVYGQTLGEPRTIEFRVGDAEPTFFGPSGLVVLDPAARAPHLSVFTINTPALDVRLHRVTPADWPAFVRFQQRQHERDDSAIPGTQVVRTQTKVKGAAGELVETAIDLGPALAGKHGHVVAVVEPTTWHDKNWKPRMVTWLQVTEIGLDAFADSTELIGWATRLADGTPLAGVEIGLLGSDQDSASAAVSTDAQGLARLPLAAGKTGTGAELVLFGRRGDDIAILPESPWGGGDGFRGQPSSDSLLWYVFDDRQMYRPGEKVSVKGWLRRLQGQELGDLAAIGDAVQDVSYVLHDPRGDELRRGTATVDAAGGFQLEIDIPANANLGWSSLQLTSRGRGEIHGRVHHHGLQIQEFRRPTFEVTASAGPGPHIVGQSAEVEMKASYYAGGGLAGTDVTWRVTSGETTFTPPNRDDFIFGRWRPWWHGFEPGGYRRGPNFGQPPAAQELTATTDASGMHVLRIDLVDVEPPLPMQVTAEATVMDVDRQAWSARANLLVHPAALYVGVKTPATFVERGTPIELQTIVVDIDGRAVPSRALTVRAERMVWSYEKRELVPDIAGAQECVTTSAKQPVPCSFTTALGGQYRITARVSDDQDRTSETQMTMWVAGGDTPPAREVEQERVTLIPDQQSYQPGDTARILVQAPFAPAQGVLTLRRAGIAEARRFTMDGPSTTLEVIIDERHIPNIHVQVDLVGAAPRTDDSGRPDDKLPRRPAYAVGELDLSVPPRARTLAVEVVPATSALAPGSKTSLDVIVRDADGQPVTGADMAVVVVDEAVLALSNYRLADPIQVFYAHRGAGARDYHSRAYVKLARPETTTEGAPPPPPAPPGAPGEAAMDMAFGGVAKAERGMLSIEELSGSEPDAPVAVRTDFRALALFAPVVRTDASGRARVPLTLPDSLTRYRVMAVAVSGERSFGKGESTITARKPLMVRPSPPRFLRFGDTFELPVVVQNQTDQPLDVQVAVRAVNTRFTASQGQALRVPANQRLELRFPAAAERAGNARIQVVAQAGQATDAAELDVPVWTPVTAEAFATYGQIDGKADGQPGGQQQAVVRQPVRMPANVITAFGGLELTTSSTELAALTDALLYLVAYPFECTEQVASRVLAVAALRDVLTAFAAENLPSASEIESAVARDIELLARLQNPDGGFDFWRRGMPSQPYVSLHVGHALARARAKGFKVPDDLYGNARTYAADIERHIPQWYGEQARRALIAYALYVEKHLGATDPGRSATRARALVGQGLDKLSLEAVGWLLYTLSGDAGADAEVATIHRHLQNRVTETAGTAHFATGYDDDAYLLLYSDRRADAVILEALIADQPDSDLIPKVTRGLLAHRTRGRWRNTQENAFVLVALDRYFHTFEKVTPDFVARAWLGDRFAGEHRFRGRQTDRHRIDVPMAWLAAQTAQAAQRDVDLTLQKTGVGRLYYRIGMRYAPADLALPAADHGFTVERNYEPVDAPGDVTRMDDGAWKIRAGARVRVRVRMVAPTRRYHVALMDPLPAGLEPLNPALAVTQSVPEDPSAPDPVRPYWSWSMPWYTHQNLRDDRAEAFSTLVWAGVHEYSYVARATTPGRFVAPPAHAEEMYFPETFGRSSTDRVIIE